jgi:hypothetical protein
LQTANWLRYFLQPLIFLFLFLSRKKESQGEDEAKVKVEDKVDWNWGATHKCRLSTPRTRHFLGPITPNNAAQNGPAVKNV